MLHSFSCGSEVATSAGAVSPSVGIFWGVAERSGGIVLVTDRTPLPKAEVYGNCLTHPHGHYDVWEAWRALGPAGLRRRGLPPTIVWHEYEEFPRGRVVFMRDEALFTVYADRRLQGPGPVAELVRLFGLRDRRHVVRSDAHYRHWASAGGER